ncbi:MAG: hypothetical protein ABSF81_05410 [Bacteroidales bacterium]
MAVFKDVFNVLILLSLFFGLTIIISAKNELSHFSNNLINFIIFFAFIISISKFFESSKIFFFDQVNYTMTSLSDNSPYIDWNFALLPVFFGMIGLFHLLTTTNSTLRKIYYNFLLIFFSFHILLSRSRRGIILLSIIILLLLVIKIISIFKSNLLIKKINLSSNWFFLTLVLFSFFLYLIIVHTSFSFKSTVIRQLFSKEELTVKNNIASNIYKNFYSFNINIPFSKVYDKLWSVKYDPKDPDNGGWGTCIHKTIFPLVGNNVEIVPKDSKGYLLDSTCNVIEWNGNAYSETALIGREVAKTDIVQASVNCYVSNDFNGVSVYLNLEGSGGLITYNEYNLNTKNTWQTLSFKKECNKKNNIRIIMGFWRYNAPDFSDLKGYVIFANPQYEIIRKKDSLLSCTYINKDTIKKNYFKNKNIVTNKKNLPTIEEIDKKFNNALLNSTDNTRIISSSFISFPSFMLNISNSILIDKDPIRKWISNLISEDTTYYGFKENIIVNAVTNSFIDSRIVRWQFAWQIFIKEYNWKQKLFGGGFKFLNWFGYYFKGDKTISDYPHNPFLYILLYSGIIGLILYILLLYKVFYYYIKYIKEYYLLFIFFLITFFFTFFSGGNPFDPPTMGFFVILPFFIHYVHKEDKTD